MPSTIQLPFLKACGEQPFKQPYQELNRLLMVGAVTTPQNTLSNPDRIYVEQLATALQATESMVANFNAATTLNGYHSGHDDFLKHTPEGFDSILLCFLPYNLRNLPPRVRNDLYCWTSPDNENPEKWLQALTKANAKVVANIREHGTQTPTEPPIHEWLADHRYYTQISTSSFTIALGDRYATARLLDLFVRNDIYSQLPKLSSGCYNQPHGNPTHRYKAPEMA